jgi:hypothetical protein
MSKGKLLGFVEERENNFYKIQTNSKQNSLKTMFLLPWQIKGKVAVGDEVELEFVVGPHSGLWHARKKEN